MATAPTNTATDSQGMLPLLQLILLLSHQYCYCPFKTAAPIPIFIGTNTNTTATAQDYTTPADNNAVMFPASTGTALPELLLLLTLLI